MFKVKLENAESSWPPPLNLIAFSVKLCRRIYLRITSPKQPTEDVQQSSSSSRSSSSLSVVPPPPNTKNTAGWWYTYYKAWLKSKLKKNDKDRNTKVNINAILSPTHHHQTAKPLNNVMKEVRKHRDILVSKNGQKERSSNEDILQQLLSVDDKITRLSN